MSRALLVAAWLFLVAAWPGIARAALTCSVSATSVQGVYASTANLDVQGSFTVTCSRDPAVDPRKPDIWLGINQGTGGRTLTRDVGGSTLNYFIYRKTFGTAIWLNSGNANQNANTNAGLLATIDFGPSGGAVVTENFPFYFRVPSGQNQPAGIYLDSAATVTVRAGSDAGGVIGSSSMFALVSIQHNCRFSTAPTAIVLAYTAFRTTAATGSSGFAITCTQGTTYTMALDATRSVVPTVNLAYSLSLTAANGVGTAGSQPYSLNVSVDAGQAGACSGANCNGTDTRTITVTY
jgi:spore coat protein U-like protein